ncbi:GMC family oxidoreductase [Aspergillus foveolatus]|uniref:GMC family oxidoreductase n=1 Tax=Aspergillus foveolatus TaxID=210207 RepID=UPI003CCD2006
MYLARNPLLKSLANTSSQVLIPAAMDQVLPETTAYCDLDRGLLAMSFLCPMNSQGISLSGTILKGGTGILPFYDYVIVGGGVSGLLVANRLTEDPKSMITSLILIHCVKLTVRVATVLVIEAGKIDNHSPAIQYPRNVLLAPVNNSWPITSLPDAELNNRTTPVQAGLVLGGGGAINGMAFDRGSPGDYDLWGELTGDDSWGWERLLPYFKKSETFTPPSEDLQEEFGIGFRPDAHGFTGPSFIRAVRQAGIPIQLDGTANAIGGFWSPNSLDPVTRERSYGRTTYHELSNERQNYHVLLEALVTRLTPDLSGVEYVPGYDPAFNAIPPGAERLKVRARKEIIMAAGAIHTPKILQLSGIGSSDVLHGLGVEQVIDLPAVGENFQDHPVLYGSQELTNLGDPTQLLSYAFSNATYDAEQGALYELNRTGRWTASWENIMSFLTAEYLNVSTTSLIQAAQQPADKFLRPGLDPTIVHGYEKVKTATLNSMIEGRITLTENLIGGIVSLQKPLSRGSVRAASTDPYNMPLVDYRAFTNPLDLTIFTQGIRFNTDVLPTTDAYQELGTVVHFPTPDLSDTELEAVIRSSAAPTYNHASGTCAMLKLEDGGCVDNKLRLYGSMGRIRVVDASIFPVIPSAHTQSTVYAVAERAADIIRERH